MKHGSLATLALLACSLLAAGCSTGHAGSHLSASRVVPGSCIADTAPAWNQQGDVHPTDSRVVDCDQPHVYEVFDVLPIPSVRLPGQHATADSYTVVANALARHDATLFDGIYGWAYQQCHYHELQALGLDGASVDGRRDESLEVPSRHFSTAMNLIDERHWLAHPSVACVLRFTDESDYPGSAHVKQERGALVHRFTRSSFPERLRSCYDYTDRDGLFSVECARPHAYEPVLVFDARAYLSATQIEDERHREVDQGLSERVSGRTDRVCGKLMSSIGLRWDRSHAGPFTDFYATWTDDQPYLSVECGLVPVTRGNQLLPGGSLVGRTAHPLHLISRAGPGGS